MAKLILIVLWVISVVITLSVGAELGLDLGSFVSVSPVVLAAFAISALLTWIIMDKARK